MTGNPGAEKGYALDFLSVVRHVATALDEVAPATLSVADMAKAYRHPLPTDLSRVRTHHGIDTDAGAVEFLVERAVAALGTQVEVDGNGRFGLTRPFDDLRYERKKLHRHVETDDDDERRTLRAMYNDLANERVFYVTVPTPRGNPRERQYRLHPLARAIPQISEKEFLELAGDVKKHGVRLPIMAFDGQVIDGRHRLAIASALKIPLRVDEFYGTEEEARDYVMSLNVHRRHLTVAQRVLIVQEFFLPEAEAEAKERQGARTDLATSAPTGAEVAEPVRAMEVAAQRSNGLATVRTLQRMEPVRKAPKTQEKIRSGQIRTASAAREEALKEQGRDPNEPTPVAQPRAAFDRLGCALGDVKSAGEAIAGDRKGNVSDEEIIARVAQIRERLDQVSALITHGAT